MYTVEKGIPVPKKRNRTIYPFQMMEIGDSFFVSCSNEKLFDTILQRIFQALWRFTRKNTDKKFQTQKQDKGVRVWRIN